MADQSAVMPVQDWAASMLLTMIVVTAGWSPFPGSFQVAIGLGAFAMVLVRFGTLNKVAPSVLLVCLLIVLSCIWSQAFRLTVVSASAYVLLAFAVWSLVHHLHRSQSLAAVVRGFRILLIGNLLVYVFAARIGRVQESYHYGALQGLAIHRNVAAFVSVLALLLFSASFMRNDRDRSGGLVTVLWMVAGAGSLLLTESGTGLLGAVVGAVVILVVGRLRTSSARRWVLALGASGVGLAVFFATADLDAVTDILGRDTTLTGRTDIWSAILPFISISPWLGYGWGALWVAGVSVTEQMWAAGGFRFYHAHDAYLDVLAQLGFVGLVGFAWLISSCLVPLLKESVRYGRSASLGIASVVIVLLMYGVTEQSFVSLMGWVALIFASAFASDRTVGEPGVSKAPAGLPNGPHG